MTDTITGIHTIRLCSQVPQTDLQRLSELLGVEAQECVVDGAPTALWILDNLALTIDLEPSADDGIAQLLFAVQGIDVWQRRLNRLGLESTSVPATHHTEPSDGSLNALILTKSSARGLGIGLTDSPSFTRTRLAATDTLSALDHIVISTGNPDGATALLGARLGLDIRMDLTRPEWQARLLFFRAGDAVVEVAHRLDTNQDAGVDQFYGLSWRTADISACHDRLINQGFDVSEVRDGRKPGTSVFTVRDAPCGIPTLIIEPAGK